MAQTLPVTREVLGSCLCLTVVFLTEGMLAQQDFVFFSSSSPGGWFTQEKATGDLMCAPNDRVCVPQGEGNAWRMTWKKDWNVTIRKALVQCHDPGEPSGGGSALITYLGVLAHPHAHTASCSSCCCFLPTQQRLVFFIFKQNPLVWSLHLHLN